MTPSNNKKQIQKKREKAIKYFRLFCIFGLVIMFAILLALVHNIGF